MNQLNKIKSKILGESNEYNLMDTWHYLMIHYGYIPFNDFLSMDAGIKNKLIIFLNKLNEKPLPKGRKR